MLLIQVNGAKLEEAAPPSHIDAGEKGPDTVLTQLFINSTSMEEST